MNHRATRRSRAAGWSVQIPHPHMNRSMCCAGGTRPASAPASRVRPLQTQQRAHLRLARSLQETRRWRAGKLMRVLRSTCCSACCCTFRLPAENSPAQQNNPLLPGGGENTPRANTTSDASASSRAVMRAATIEHPLAASQGAILRTAAREATSATASSR